MNRQVSWLHWNTGTQRFEGVALVDRNLPDNFGRELCEMFGE